MTILIILIIVAVLFFVFKGKITKLISELIIKKRSQKTEEVEFIYTPIGMTRTFGIEFTVEELGGGKARIYVYKTK